MDVRRREYTLLVGSVLSVWSTVDAVYRTFNMYTDMAYNVHTMRIARVTLDREVKVESTPTSSSASTSTTSSAPSVAMGTIVGLLIDKGLVDAVLKELKKKQTTADSEYLQPATTTATITNPAIEYPTLAPTINTYPDTNNNNDIGKNRFVMSPLNTLYPTVPPAASHKYQKIGHQSSNEPSNVNYIDI